MPTPFDVENGTIDNFLAKRLTKLCGPKKKLAVGGAEHNKEIIEVKLVSKLSCCFCPCE